jgi:hypothetical protein
MSGHLVVATGIAIAAWSMGIGPAWSGVVFTYAAATAGAVALFLFPGSHVAWDVSFAALLSFTGNVDLADAAAVTVVCRVQQSVIVLAGVVSMAYFARDLFR